MSYITNKKNILLLIPIILITIYFLVKYYLLFYLLSNLLIKFNKLYLPISISITMMSILYRFDNIIFIMHTKPIYFETVTIFKPYIDLNIINSNNNTLLSETQNDIKLIKEVDIYLSNKFKNIFRHCLIIIDSIIIGIIFSYCYIHMNITIDNDILVKNIGILGGYISLCGKIHIYIGKIILSYLKSKKEITRDYEIKRRKNSFEIFEINPINIKSDQI
jgi:hypothetical protein